MLLNRFISAPKVRQARRYENMKFSHFFLLSDTGIGPSNNKRIDIAIMIQLTITVYIYSLIYYIYINGERSIPAFPSLLKWRSPIGRNRPRLYACIPFLLWLRHREIHWKTGCCDRYRINFNREWISPSRREKRISKARALHHNVRKERSWNHCSSFFNALQKSFEVASVRI